MPLDDKVGTNAANGLIRGTANPLRTVIHTNGLTLVFSGHGESAEEAVTLQTTNSAASSLRTSPSPS